MTDAPHDTLFKAAFQHLPWAAQALAAALGPALAARIDFSTLRLVPGSFIDEAFRSRYTDLLYTVLLAGHPVFIYLLYEHQSTDDPWMPLRMFGYEERAWTAFLRDNPRARRLPMILPVVLHHSEAAGTRRPASRTSSTSRPTSATRSATTSRASASSSTT